MDGFQVLENLISISHTLKVLLLLVRFLMKMEKALSYSLVHAILISH
jgi:hypothetical protein